MGTIFSETLTRLRREAGFPTAYGFYNDNGGAPVLKFTYRKYLLFEQGKELPAVEKLLPVFFALGLMPKSFPSNELTIAWLKTLAGEEAYKYVLQPVISEEAAASNLSPLHKAVKRTLSENKYQLSPAQFQALLADRDTYLCFLALTRDSGSWSAEDVAKTLELEKSAAAGALKALEKIKLLKEVKKGVYKCPLAACKIEYPHLNMVAPALREKLDIYHKELAASGVIALLHGCVVRADWTAFRDFFPLMNLNISTAQTYSITEKTEKSALFWVEGKITKLRNF